MTRALDVILEESSARHKHLCPRQVLGARMALYAAELLGIELPRHDKRLLAISETDGCAVDGLIAATGCRVGSRTLRIVDFGKVAATFVDTYTEKGIRIVPYREARSIALKHVPNARNAWGAFAIVLELVPAPLAAEVSASLPIPTIGIGAGPSCDGQVLVLPDMLGLNDRFSPKFLKRYAALADEVRTAVRAYASDVGEGCYPGADHSVPA